MALLLMVVLGSIGILHPAIVFADLPIYCDFDSDLADAPPATGGQNQPTQLVIPPSGSLLVRAVANGLDTQPCEISSPSAGEYGSISFRFSPVVGQLLRIEATVSINRRTTAYLMQTFASNGAGATSLSTALDGSLLGDWTGTVVGSYEADAPFRVRMDIDMNLKTYAITVDDEMNGFDDDQVFPGLAFIESPQDVPDIAWLRASLECNYSGLTSVAYDDIVAVLDPAPVGVTTWGWIKHHMSTAP